MPKLRFQCVQKQEDINGVGSVVLNPVVSETNDGTEGSELAGGAIHLSLRTTEALDAFKIGKFYAAEFTEAK